MKAILEHVLRTGDIIFPVSDGNCIRYDGSIAPKKMPLVKWKDQATNDFSTIEKWWKKWPTALVGRAETAVELTIDIDRHSDGHDGVETLQELIGGHPEVVKLFKSTQRVQTPSNGYHFKFVNSNLFRIDQTQAIWPGVDIRTAEKGFLVIPPSTGYLLEVDNPRQEITQEFFEIYKEGAKEQSIQRFNNIQNGIIPKSERNGTLASHAGKFKQMGLPDEVILDTLDSMNRNMCEEPLPNREIIAIVQSYSRYQPGIFTIEYSLESIKSLFKEKANG